jgi:thiol-disulfide isomerase/thioredoxin
VPSGVRWALLLAAVTLAIAVAVSWDADGAEETALLDDRIAMPADPEPGSGAGPGSPAPQVAFTTFEGDATSLAEYRGAPLVVNFWSSTCIPCVTEMPEFDAVHTELDGTVAFLGINTAEGSDPALRFLERVPVGYDLARDPDGSVLRAFGRSNLPTTVLIDAEGTVRDIHTGMLSGDDLRSRIAEVTG